MSTKNGASGNRSALGPPSCSNVRRRSASRTAASAKGSMALSHLGEGGVRVLASRVQRETKMTFVQGHHLARRGLANQRLLRQHTGIELFSHSSNAVRAHLFVVRQHQHQRSGGTGATCAKALMAMASNPSCHEPRPYKRPDCSRTTNGSLVQPWASTGTQSRWPETIKPSRVASTSGPAQAIRFAFCPEAS